ncbi:hypothetical protein EI94DRAFT_304243 [Lactarius quietus]|nr:hypothetical protein EI94DRAFT_304243 [Lactarius quietus]
MSSNMTPFSFFPTSTAAPCAFGLFGQDPRDTHAATRTSLPLSPDHRPDVPSGGRGASAAGTPLSMGYGDFLEAFKNRIFHTHPCPFISAISIGASHPSIIRLWLHNLKPPHHHISPASPMPKQQRAIRRRVVLWRWKPSHRHPCIHRESSPGSRPISTDSS